MIFLNKPFQLSLFFLFISCSFLSDLFAQQKKKDADLPDSCEIISLKLDSVADAFRKVKKEVNFLIIIGGAPKGASSRYNSTRISNAVKYLSRINKINSERIVFGIGQQSSQYGYLKFFVGGELVTEIKTSGKGKLCFGMGETFDY